MKATNYIYALVLIAGIILFLHLPDLSFHQLNVIDWLILMVLSVFLFLIKRYPVWVGSGLVTLDFPILYLFVLKYGYIEAAVFLIFVLIASDIIEGRPTRVSLFNASNLVISLWVADQFVTLYLTAQPVGFTERVTHVVLYLVLYTLMNNLLIDLFLWLRPQAYSFRHWIQKLKLEIFSFFISFGYSALLYYLDAQQRAEDLFTYTFFYMPLVAGSIISHGTTRLAEEKRKLEILLQASKKMNESIELKDVVEGMEEAVTKVVDYTFGIIYIKKQGTLAPERVFGYQVKEHKSYYLMLGDKVSEMVLERKEAQLISNFSKKENQISSNKKEINMTAFLAVPLILEKEVVGVIALGRQRSHSYYEEDKNILQILANQATIALKNTRLVKEREKRIIVEERNRLAREIHDGIAQSIAAIAIQIESCIRVFEKNPTQVKRWLEDGLLQLRNSIKDIRKSIYSLRPKPTDTLGLQKAIRNKLDEFRISTNIQCEFQAKGTSNELPKKLEETIFEIVSEALQNIYKHAQANKVQILVNYHRNKVDVFVRDNGIGFSLAQVLMRNSDEEHFGLLNMNGLVQKCEGSFQVNSKEGLGTEIEISIPLIERAEDEVS
jgi:signal transduction histidine kinase